jgi:co-chaperonin GroES (HSP10)
MFELKPMNKYVWLDPITAENKVGSLYVVSHSQNSYQLGKVRAVADCDEAKGITIGSTVLYDTLGAVNHRVGTQSITTVKVMNIVGVVADVGGPA